MQSLPLRGPGAHVQSVAQSLSRQRSSQDARARSRPRACAARRPCYSLCRTLYLLRRVTYLLLGEQLGELVAEIARAFHRYTRVTGSCSRVTYLLLGEQLGELVAHLAHAQHGIHAVAGGAEGVVDVRGVDAPLVRVPAPGDGRQVVQSLLPPREQTQPEPKPRLHRLRGGTLLSLQAQLCHARVAPVSRGEQSQPESEDYTGIILLYFAGPPVPITAKMHSTPQTPECTRNKLGTFSEYIWNRRRPSDAHDTWKAPFQTLSASKRLCRYPSSASPSRLSRLAILSCPMANPSGASLCSRSHTRSSASWVASTRSSTASAL
eukprot:1195891-Prorocentrum_minimum.AAC.3